MKLFQKNEGDILIIEDEEKNTIMGIQGGDAQRRLRAYLDELGTLRHVAKCRHDSVEALNKLS